MKGLVDVADELEPAGEQEALLDAGAWEVKTHVHYELERVEEVGTV